MRIRQIRRYCGPCKRMVFSYLHTCGQVEVGDVTKPRDPRPIKGSPWKEYFPPAPQGPSFNSRTGTARCAKGHPCEWGKFCQVCLMADRKKVEELTLNARYGKIARGEAAAPPPEGPRAPNFRGRGN